jgi:hypothetical protein
VAGGFTVTLTGTNMGALPAQASVSMNLLSGVTPCPVTAATHTTVECTMPSGVGVNRPMTVTVGGQTSPQFLVSFQPPKITGISGCPSGATDCPVTGGITITISGSSLGSSATPATITVKSQPCTGVAYPDATHAVVTCTLPAIPTGGYNVVTSVTVATQEGTSTLLSYGGPTVMPNTLTLVSAFAPGPAIALSATNAADEIYFDCKNCNTGAITVVYGRAGLAYPKQFVCTFISYATVSTTVGRVRCKLSGGTGKNLVLMVQVGVQLSLDGADTISFPKPVISPNTLMLSGGIPSNFIFGSSSEGEFIEFGGQNFGSFDATTFGNLVVVSYGSAGGPYNQQCTSVTGSDTRVVCRTSPGSGGPYVFQVASNEQPSDEGTDKFNYPLAPEVDSVTGCPVQAGATTTDCPTIGGTVITIAGRYFVAATAAAAVYVGAVNCPITQITGNRCCV